MSNQEKMPFVEALESYKEQHFVPFHTPGHKIGVEAPQLLKDWMGPALPYDLGVMYALDDLHEPEGELKEAQDLTAQLYGADYCWFSINGTTALIEAMIMGTVGPDETIIIPREAHRSVISGLVLSGAKPVYMDCQFDERWGIPLGVSLNDAVKTMDANPEAKAILLVYPNYYGVGVDIVNIVKEAHKRGMIVLVDEAHGPHLPFSKNLPVEAIASGRAIEAASSQWDDPCDPKEVFVRFRQNDEKATALVTRSAQAIANLIADLKIGLDMQKVVVGGSVGLAEGYLPLVQSLLSELPAVYHCELESAKFGQDAGLIGAAYWVKDCLLQAKNTGVVYG